MKAIFEEADINNQLIAKFMGGYIRERDNFDFSPDSVYYSDIKLCWEAPKNVPFWFDLSKLGGFNYKSWDWLMPVIRKINGMGKEYQFTIFKTYVSCTVERSGKFYKDFSFSHAEYITEEQSDIKAAFNLVIRFIEWYNQINNEINNETNNKT